MRALACVTFLTILLSCICFASHPPQASPSCSPSAEIHRPPVVLENETPTAVSTPTVSSTSTTDDEVNELESDGDNESKPAGFPFPFPFPSIVDSLPPGSQDIIEALFPSESSSPSITPAITPSKQPLSTPSVSRTASPTRSPTASPVPINICETKGASICFALDESGSISESDFAKVKQFALRTSENLLANLSSARVGVIAFNESQRVVSPLEGDYNSLSTSISNMDQQKGGTNILRGGLKCYGMLNGQSSPRAVILLTDGNSKEWNYSYLMRRNNIYSIAIGVGSEINAENLKSLATVEDLAFFLDYDELEKLSEDILKIICQNKISPMPSPSPTPTSCQCGDSLWSEGSYCFEKWDHLRCYCATYNYWFCPCYNLTGITQCERPTRSPRSPSPSPIYL